MNTAIWWFGAIHIAAYAIAAFIFVSAAFIDWAVQRFKLKADIMRAYGRMLQERRRAKEGDFHGA